MLVERIFPWYSFSSLRQTQHVLREDSLYSTVIAREAVRKPASAGLPGELVMVDLSQ